MSRHNIFIFAHARKLEEPFEMDSGSDILRFKGKDDEIWTDDATVIYLDPKRYPPQFGIQKTSPRQTTPDYVLDFNDPLQAFEMDTMGVWITWEEDGKLQNDRLFDVKGKVMKLSKLLKLIHADLELRGIDGACNFFLQICRKKSGGRKKTLKKNFKKTLKKKFKKTLKKNLKKKRNYRK